MTAADDWNTQVIAEFRANGGEVGGPFAGAPMVLLHHTGRRSGREFIAPLMYLGYYVITAIEFPRSSRGMETSVNYPFNFTP